jgi:hypothetical protein
VASKDIGLNGTFNEKEEWRVPVGFVNLVFAQYLNTQSRVF